MFFTSIVFSAAVKLTFQDIYFIHNSRWTEGDKMRCNNNAQCNLRKLFLLIKARHVILQVDLQGFRNKKITKKIYSIIYNIAA